MKLRNKKTGEIIDLNKGSIKEVCFGSKIQLQATDRHNKPIWIYNSLAELNEEWEDYEEPKKWWYLDVDGEVCESHDEDDMTKDMKEIGNYFETKEEAEKAVEKLKAWKRLKDKGFKFEWWISKPEGNEIDFYLDEFEWSGQVTDDLNLLFGGNDESSN